MLSPSITPLPPNVTVSQFRIASLIDQANAQEEVELSCSFESDRLPVEGRIHENPPVVSYSDTTRSEGSRCRQYTITQFSGKKARRERKRYAIKCAARSQRDLQIVGGGIRIAEERTQMGYTGISRTVQTAAVEGGILISAGESGSSLAAEVYDADGLLVIYRSFGNRSTQLYNNTLLSAVHKLHSHLKSPEVKQGDKRCRGHYDWISFMIHNSYVEISVSPA
ncbi:hypothetical protein FRC02_002091 [Tulasnella sp. 418]|nr:hypothetical protein FRC02_002091 [Tulasnella sp. 418]